MITPTVDASLNCELSVRVMCVLLCHLSCLVFSCPLCHFSLFYYYAPFSDYNCCWSMSIAVSPSYLFCLLFFCLLSLFFYWQFILSYILWLFVSFPIMTLLLFQLITLLTFLPLPTWSVSFPRQSFPQSSFFSSPSQLFVLPSQLPYSLESILYSLFRWCHLRTSVLSGLFFLLPSVMMFLWDS